MNFYRIKDFKCFISYDLFVQIDFGRDFEKQLDFYVDARASFSNLDPVLVMLVQRVNLLALQTRAIVNGNHSRKTASFVRVSY